MVHGGVDLVTAAAYQAATTTPSVTASAATGPVPDGRGRQAARFVVLPVLAAVVVMWISLGTFTYIERDIILERAQSQLGITVSTLADFNELAEQAGSGVSSTESRAAAIWRALLQYPTAAIWVVTDGAVSAGEPPAGDMAAFVVVEDTRANFSVHAALPRSDALAEWRETAWQRAAALLFVSVIFLLLTRFLGKAMRQREVAEREAATAQERVIQLALYRSELEQTVSVRTAEIKQANARLETELVERKAAEDQLREHDALLNVVTKSAAELLGSQHEEAIELVLGMIGQTIAVSRVQLCQLDMDAAGGTHAEVRNEWRRHGIEAGSDPRLARFNLSAEAPRALNTLVGGGPASFFVDELSGPLAPLFEQAEMRSFLMLPVLADDKLWGALCFVDSARNRRQWSWAESDTLKTLAGLIGVAITRDRYVQQLADANMIVQNSPTILYRLRGEPTFPLIYVSHNLTKFGHDPLAMIGNPDWLRSLVEAADQDKVYQAMARVLDKDAEAASIEFRMRTGDGHYRWVENRYTPIRDRDGRLSEVEGIIIDITERKLAEDRIALLARTDSLTGLANRVTFTERLRQLFASSQRGASPFAILCIDLDRFKDVNDTLGHPVGDLLLVEVASRLRTATRDSDVVARLGGDEFAVLQTEISEPAHAGILAAKIQKSLGEPYLLDGHEINIVSASIGIAPYHPGCASPDVLLAQADLALYRSKDEGRNQYHFHSADLDVQVQERVSMADDLRYAIDHNQLELYYQPQVDIVSGRIVGMEALVRWNHPERGLLSAGRFIAVAEKAGLTKLLGQRVIDAACRQMRLWHDAGVAPPVVAINLSLSQLRNSRELLKAVTEALQRWHIAPEELEFDVTEATLAQATLMNNDVLVQLRQLGARIAIDDFGTEYSSFEYLRAYDVTHLKIAQSYINAATTDPERAATIRAIMNIARELDIGVIAEGVETEQERSLLAATGTMTRAQGHFFSEAVAVDRANELLRQGRMDVGQNAAVSGAPPVRALGRGQS